MAVGPSRRDFVAALLGGSAALALGCGGAQRRGPVPGRLLDTGMARGHAAVRFPSEWPTGAPTRRVRVLVIGAGVAGLSAAWRLRQAGVTDVLVVELGDVIGGTSRGGTLAGLAAPWGAHYIVAPQAEQAELVRLLADAGALEGFAADGTPIVDEAYRCREPEERLYDRGVWTAGLWPADATAADAAQLRAFHAEVDRWVAWRDTRGRRAFALPTTAGSDDAEVLALDREPFGAWLDARGLTSPHLRWLVDYACRDDYALLAADTSAWAGLAYFASRQPRPGVEPQGVVTWPDGNASLVRSLAHGATVETGVACVDLDEAAGAPPSPRVRARAIGPAGPFQIEADLAICATPRFVTRRLVRGLRGAVEPSTDVGAWAVANLALRDRPRTRRRDAPPAWDNVFRDSASLGYVSATHQAGRDRGPTVWTWYYPFTELDPSAVRRTLEGATHADWVEVVLADLARAHRDIHELVTEVDVALWGHGMVRPRVGARVAAARAQPVGGVHLAHTDLSGIALFEEAFAHGVRAADEVAARLRAEAS